MRNLASFKMFKIDITNYLVFSTILIIHNILYCFNYYIIFNKNKNRSMTIISILLFFQYYFFLIYNFLTDYEMRVHYLTSTEKRNFIFLD